MDGVSLLLGTVGGLGVGLAVGAVIAARLARAAVAAETGIAAERLAACERERDALRAQRESAVSAQDALRSAASASAQAEAAASARAAASSERLTGLEAERADLLARLRELGAQLAEQTARLHAERTAAELHQAQQREMLDAARRELTTQFQALSATALEHSNRQFLDLAAQRLTQARSDAAADLDARRSAIDGALAPMRETLEKVGAGLADLQRSRAAAEATLGEQVRQLAAGQQLLGSETANLVRALRVPQVRGRWGEVQLRRVVELAGMLAHCDFHEQVAATSEEGRRLRPDLVVHLPGRKLVVVDAKAPLQAYLDALASSDEATRTAKLRDHARQIRAHIVALAGKAYWEQFEPTPEFVVLFLPGETFFSAALEADPGLIEAGAEAKVILATPTTLIALLRAVSYGWRQDQVAEHARTVSQLGSQLHDRLRIFVGHFERMRAGLDGAVRAYNEAIGSLESRVLVAARRFPELGAGHGEIPILVPSDTAIRQLTIPLGDGDDAASPPVSGNAVSTSET